MRFSREKFKAIFFYLRLVSGLQSRNMNAKIILNLKEASLHSTKLQWTIHFLFKEKTSWDFFPILVSLSRSPAFVEDEAKLNLSLNLDISKGALTEA